MVSAQRVLLEEVNPHGTVQAVVEADDQVVHFYLYGAPDSGFGVKSVWVRNLSSAPDALDVEAMKAGRAPMNPQPHCKPAPLEVPAELSVLWLPEGNGAALLEDGQPIAIIPPWSGLEGFNGYARAAAGTGPLAWELEADNALFERLAEAADYWRAWGESDPWPHIQSNFLEAYEAGFGPRSNYYAIDGGNWPPKAIVRVPYEDKVILATLGVSAVPQPNVELYSDHWREHRRVELATALPQTLDDDGIKRIASYLSAQSEYPWQRMSWFGDGHTIPCDSWASTQFEFALLVRDHPLAKRLTLPTVFGEPVQLLWFLPITASEQTIASDQGSSSVLDQLPPNRWFTS